MMSLFEVGRYSSSSFANYFYSTLHRTPQHDVGFKLNERAPSDELVNLLRGLKHIPQISVILLRRHI
jgi:hypothetical protein